MQHSPGFLKIVEESRKKIKETDVSTIKKRLAAKEKFVLVDVREDSEWENGHLPGAVHIGRGVIERDIESKVPDKGAEIVLYCGGGFRSAMAADNIQRMGYVRVLSMDGGFRGWVEAGGEVVK